MKISDGRAYEMAVGATAISLGLALCLVFLWVPDARGLGLDFKIFFFHVPAAWLMLLSALVAGVAGARALLTDGPDQLAAAATDLAVIFGLVVLVTGPLWAWRAWGKPWIWEPRLTTSLVCWLTYAVALTARASGPSGKKTALLLALLGALEVPLVYLSVRWWSGGHHPPTSLVPSLSSRFALTLAAAMVAATALWGLLLTLGVSRRKNQAQLLRLEALAKLWLGTVVVIVVSTSPGIGRAWAGPTGRAVGRSPRRAETAQTHMQAQTPDGPAQKGQGQDEDGFRPYRGNPESGAKPSKTTTAAVLAAYLAFWAILFAYLVLLARRERRLSRRIEALENLLEQAEKKQKDREENPR